MLTERIIEALRFAYEQEGKEVKKNVESVPKLPVPQINVP